MPASCAQVLDIDKPYHLGGSAGATGGTNTIGTGGMGGGTTTTGGSSGGTTTGVAGTGGTGGATCSNGVKSCGQPADCDPTENDCVLSTCEGGCCGTQNVAANTALLMQTPEDCQQVVCDGGGATKTVDDNGDVPADQDDCHAGSCANGSPAQSAKAEGVACASGGGKVCDGNGTCVECTTNGDCLDGAKPICCKMACMVAVAEVSAGGLHTCARKTDGTLWCWGYNGNGELGDGTTIGPACGGGCKPSPVQVNTLGNNVVEVSGGGGAHTCARKTDGTLWCWGYNASAQLGDGTTNSSPVPVQVGSLGAGVAEVSAGGAHTCARKTDGTLWCWGDGGSGQLGNGAMANSPVPVQVSALGTAVAQVVAGGAHTCARKTDGTLWCWGNNNYGQVGDGTMNNNSVPTQISDAITAAAAREDHTCARKTGGTLWCWGRNDYGQLGDESTTAKSTPVQVSGLGAQVAEVTLGSRHTCAIKADGTLWCWGRNNYGQLGNGTTGGPNCGGDCVLSPVQVGSLAMTVTLVDAGSHHTCARTMDGIVWCWGHNGNGALGDGTTTGPACNNTCDPSPVQALVVMCQ